MKFVIQRVNHAEVKVDGEIVGKIGKGFLVLDVYKRQDPICVRPVSGNRTCHEQCDRFKDPVIFYRNEGVLCNTFQISYDG